MGYSVGAGRGFAGVTVRTLHHYDKAGLLSARRATQPPATAATDADLARLQQILFYRELGFPARRDRRHPARPAGRRAAPSPGATAAVCAERSPGWNAARGGGRAEPSRSAAHRRDAHPGGNASRSSGEISFDLNYATEAQLRWQVSAAYREAMTRAAGHTRGRTGGGSLTEASPPARRTAGRLRRRRAPPTAERAMDLAEQHRRHLAPLVHPLPAGHHRRIATTSPPTRAPSPSSSRRPQPTPRRSPPYVSKAIRTQRLRRDGSAPIGGTR
ncbi:MerR family transcriptional regulator [Streptomyces tricolor]|nr:MerR family transcriptional regulator [Streptomyces tricolor]